MPADSSPALVRERGQTERQAREGGHGTAAHSRNNKNSTAALSLRCILQQQQSGSTFSRDWTYKLAQCFQNITCYLVAMLVHYLSVFLLRVPQWAPSGSQGPGWQQRHVKQCMPLMSERCGLIFMYSSCPLLFTGPMTRQGETKGAHDEVQAL